MLEDRSGEGEEAAEEGERERVADARTRPIITEEICARAIGGRSVKSSITALTRRYVDLAG